MYESTFFALPPRWMLALTCVGPLAAFLLIHVWQPAPFVLARTAVLLALSLGFLLYLLDRPLYEQLLWENGPVELWTALVLLVVGIRMLGAARRFPTPTLRPCVGLLGIAFLFASGEELSWGQNLFQWESPDVFRRWNAQQETNLHNITGRIFHTKGLTIIALLGFGVVAPRLARLPIRAGSWMTPVLALAPQPSFTPLFVVASVLCLDLPTGLEAELGELLGVVLFAVTLPVGTAAAVRVPALALAPALSDDELHPAVTLAGAAGRAGSELMDESPRA